MAENTTLDAREVYEVLKGMFDSVHDFTFNNTIKEHKELVEVLVSILKFDIATKERIVSSPCCPENALKILLQTDQKNTYQESVGANNEQISLDQ